MELAPIALFVYNRFKHTREVIDALQKNSLAKDSEFFIFSDGPKSESVKGEVDKVRGYLKTVGGFKKISIIERLKNRGLSQSVISGVTEIVDKYGKIIVLEDDLIVSPYFLKFMNDGLSFYENEERIVSICGYMYPIKIKNQDTVFFRIPDSWGWATWKRGWDIFEPDGNKLLRELKERKLVKQFNLNGALNFTDMLKRQAQGKIDSWVIRWYASSFLNNKLSIYPCKSLVDNIGFDFSGTNCGFMADYKTEISNAPVLINKITIQENQDVFKKITMFFKLNNLNILRRIVNKALFSFRR